MMEPPSLENCPFNLIHIGMWLMTKDTELPHLYCRWLWYWFLNEDSLENGEPWLQKICSSMRVLPWQLFLIVCTYIYIYIYTLDFVLDESNLKYPTTKHTKNQSFVLLIYSHNQIPNDWRSLWFPFLSIILQGKYPLALPKCCYCRPRNPYRPCRICFFAMIGATLLYNDAVLRTLPLILGACFT